MFTGMIGDILNFVLIIKKELGVRMFLIIIL